MVSRYCADCEKYLLREEYSDGEWKKGARFSKCFACALKENFLNLNLSNPSDSACRKNDATAAEAKTEDLAFPFAQGSFRKVARGRYTAGKREGEPCVLKWFKKGVVFEEHFYYDDLKAVRKAIHLVGLFNEAKVVDKKIRVNVPSVWSFSDEAHDCWANAKVLVEPFIEGYHKFNSNSGWKDDSTPWLKVMQALSHFSYHISNEDYVLCDLQGGIYRNEVILTDPAVLSKGGEFGVTDLGPDGISSFFSHHVCNEYCSPNWSRPESTRNHYPAVPHTTMELHQGYVPTAFSRPANTRARR